MVSMSAIAGATASLKVAFDIGKGLVEMRRDWDIQDKINEMNRALSEAYDQVLSAKREQAAMLDENESLKTEIARLKAWDSERQRYELKPRSPHNPGALAYRLKEDCGDSEQQHWLCPTCFDDGRKSILQERQGPRRTIIASCPRCKTSLEFYK